MDKKTIGIIYALKQCKYCSDSTIRMFMSEYTDSDWNKVGREQIDNLLRQTCADFIASADFPIRQVLRYFDSYNSVFCNNEFEMMVNFLQQIQVKDFENKYINGFIDNPFKEFKVFEREEYEC